MTDDIKRRVANMKFRKFIRLTGIILLSIILMAFLGLAVWSGVGTYPARSVALSALESSGSVTVTRGKTIVFEPAQDAKIGLIFYPGGLVEPAAYAPVIKKLAENGVFAVITPMPFNLAIFTPDAANAVMEQYPQISSWILAGHSLGGAAAAIFADNNPEKIAALALWDSYPPDSADLSDNNLAVLSVFGTKNGFPNTDNFNDKRHLLPEDTIFAAIEGANHAQFGDYGPQKNDVAAVISLAEQHEKVTEVMLDFIFMN
jgi:pimeloyl-ACP methyl ester carboxylesterase